MFHEANHPDEAFAIAAHVITRVAGVHGGYSAGGECLFVTSSYGCKVEISGDGTLTPFNYERAYSYQFHQDSPVGRFPVAK